MSKIAISQMPGYLKISQIPIQIFEGGIFLRFWKFLKWLEISKIPRHSRNFPNARVTGKFPKCLRIWEISQMLGYLENFPMPEYLGNFPNAGFWEIPRISSYFRNFQNLKNIPPSNTYKNLGNFPSAWVSGKFPKYLQIFEGSIFLRFWKFLKWREISKIPRHLGNSPNTQTFEEFPKYLGFWETP